jgi:cytochrome c oxidase subunit 2
MTLGKRLGGTPAFRRIAAFLTLAVLAFFVAPRLGFAADGHVVEPHPWQLGFQESATLIKDQIAWLHGYLLVIITVITLFVLGLLVYVIVRFNARSNPVPSRVTHNTLIEVLWTVVPVIILVSIAVPSFRLMYYEDRIPKLDMTVKVTGHQWYWSYEYPDFNDVSFDSNLIQDKDLKPGQKRLLDVDNRLVVPVDTFIRVQIAGSDVMHSWFMPSFGVQMYSVPGRLNEAWINVKETGVYYGQCNQICGINHAFMPIVVQAVSKPDFDKWINEKKAAQATDGKAVRVAAAAQ